MHVGFVSTREAVTKSVVLITFRVRYSRGEMYIGHMAVCVSVCLPLAAFPHYCTNPEVTWGRECLYSLSA